MRCCSDISFFLLLLGLLREEKDLSDTPHLTKRQTEAGQGQEEATVNQSGLVRTKRTIFWLIRSLIGLIIYITTILVGSIAGKGTCDQGDMT